MTSNSRTIDAEISELTNRKKESRMTTPQWSLNLGMDSNIEWKLSFCIDRESNYIFYSCTWLIFNFSFAWLK